MSGGTFGRVLVAGAVVLVAGPGFWMGDFLLRGEAPVRREGRRASTADDFVAIAEVLKSPRCVNCHPAGDMPLQDDEGRLHAMRVQRGPDGHGLPAMRCSNCHGRRNFPAPNAPPGAPNWHLPPPETPMVFEGKTPAEICRQMKDPAQNGNKTLEELVHHLTADSLVLWGWDPGPGRTLPPLSQPEFARVVREWAEAGAPCPQDDA